MIGVHVYVHVYTPSAVRRTQNLRVTIAPLFPHDPVCCAPARRYEMRDRTNLLLPGVQPALVAAVVKAAAGKPVVLVLMTGGVVDVSAFVVFFLPEHGHLSRPHRLFMPAVY